MSFSKYKISALIFFCLVPIILMATGLALYSVNAPYGDDFEAILKYLNMEMPERILHLADFHNEHRILLTRLFSETAFCLQRHIDFRVLMWIGNIGWFIFSLSFSALYFKEKSYLGAIFSAWLIVGFYDQENSFWAMTAIQNHLVIVFAFFACILFPRPILSHGALPAILCATLSTFTSGGGIMTFPSMLLILIHGLVFSNQDQSSRKSILKQILFILLYLIFVTTAYFHGFPHSISTTSEIPLHERVISSMAFLVCFMGNLLPSPALAIPWGCIIFIWLLFICFHIKAYKGDSLSIFAFISFIMANIFAAAIFRGTDHAAALAGRYRNVSAVLISSLFYLTNTVILKGPNAKKHFTRLCLLVCFLFSVAHTVHAIKNGDVRKNNQINGILMWPVSAAGYGYPTDTNMQARTSAIFRTSLQRKVYIPPPRQ